MLKEQNNNKEQQSSSTGIKSHILDFIGLGTIKYSLSELDTEIQMFVRKNYLIDIGLLLLSIFFGVVTKEITWFITAIGMVLLFALFHTYQMFLFLCGKVYYLDGKLKDVRTSNILTAFFKKATKNGQVKLELKASDGTYMVSAPNAKGYRPGNIIRVYMTGNGVYMEDADTYTIPSPLLITKIKNGEVMRKEEN